MKGDISYESIYKVCKAKGHTNAKADEITKTVLAYLDHSIYDSADKICCNTRTIHRRINEFLKP